MQTRLNGLLVAVLGISLTWGLMAVGCSYTAGGDSAGGGTGADAGTGGGSSPFVSGSGGGSSSQDSPFGTSSEGGSNGTSVFGSSSSGGGSDSPFGGGGGGGSVGSDVDGSKEIGGLSDEEKSKVCTAAREYALSLLSKEELCRFFAYLNLAFGSSDGSEITDEELQQACTDTKETCVEDQTFSAEEACTSVSGGDSCTVTVRKWEACEQALSDQFAQNVKQLPACSEVTTDDLSGSSSDGSSGDETPAECTELKENCPEFYANNVGPTTSSTEPDPVQDVGVVSDSGTGDTGVSGDTGDTGVRTFDLGSDL